MFILLLYLRSRWNSWYFHYDTVLVWLKAVFSSLSPYRNHGTELFLREMHTSSAPFYSLHNLRHQRSWSIWRGMTRELSHHPEVMVPNVPITEATSIASPVTLSFFVRVYLINLHFPSVSVCHVCNYLLRSQKWESDPMKLELQAVVRSWNGFWELSSVPLEEQQASLVPDPSISPVLWLLSW